MEQQFVTDYEALLEKLIAELDALRLPLAIELTGLPSEIRGFGPVKAIAVDRTEHKRSELSVAWDASGETNQ